MTGGGSRREDRPVTDDERRYKITFITIFISLLFTRHIKTVGLADVELTICLFVFVVVFPPPTRL